MPNIFNRPMFRKGGSAAHGTGITSGLDQPRAKYADGPDEEGVSYKDATDEALSNIGDIDPEKIGLAMDVIRNKLKPTSEQTIGDFLTSFGASGTGNAGELQTLGGALSNTAKTMQALEEKRRLLADKYAGIGAVSTIKSMTKNPVVDEMQRKAKLAAETRDSPNSKYKGMTYEDAYRAALNDLMNKKTNIKEFAIEKSPKAQIELKAKDYEKQGLQSVPAKDLATIEYQINNDPKYADERARWQGSLLTSYVERTPTGGYKLKENIRQGPVGKKYKANDLFYDPNDRIVYMYKGPASGEFVPYSMNKK